MRLVLLIVMLAVLAAPASASAYINAANCEAGLRSGGPGDRDHDDDIHRYGVYLGASSATFRYDLVTRYDNTRVAVAVVFHFTNRGDWTVPGYCHGSNASFNDNVPFTPAGW